MAVLRKLAGDEPGFPAVLLFVPAPVGAAEAFFAERWPDVPVVCDPRYELYEALGSERMSLLSLLNPVLWWKGLKVFAKGHRNGKPQGDVWLLGGALLVAPDGTVRWQHEPTDPSDIVRAGMVPVDTVPVDTVPVDKGPMDNGRGTASVSS